MFPCDASSFGFLPYNYFMVRRHRILCGLMIAVSVALGIGSYFAGPHFDRGPSVRPMPADWLMYFTLPAAICLSMFALSSGWGIEPPSPAWTRKLAREYGLFLVFGLFATFIPAVIAVRYQWNSGSMAGCQFLTMVAFGGLFRLYKYMNNPRRSGINPYDSA